MKHWIIILLGYSCLQAQGPAYSRVFATSRKLVPLAILNKHPAYFYMLRYNKLAHDITIERRAKPGAEILSFSPLKLDSANSNQFNYEQLDYLFFETGGRVFFVFERARNNRKDIFMKEIDSTGRTSGFIPVASLERERNVTDIRFRMTLTGQNKLLVIASVYDVTGTTRKTAILFDPLLHRKVWSRKLPFENVVTGYSDAFDSNGPALSYVLVCPQVVSFKRVVVSQMQLEVPVFKYDSLFVVTLLDGTLYKKKLQLENLSGLGSLTLSLTDTVISVGFQCNVTDEKRGELVYFYNEQLNTGLSRTLASHVTPLNQQNIEKLTFYDGSDDDAPADKTYYLTQSTRHGGYRYVLSERREENFYKELLLLKIDTGGLVRDQLVIPRKTFYFDDRTRFRNMGTTMQSYCGGNYYMFMLENPQNMKAPPDVFNYHHFATLRNMGRANLVCYILGADGLQKRPVFRNGNYDIVPLKYTSDQCDAVLYMNMGGAERFVTLSLNQL